MYSGQNILVIGALSILTLLILNFYDSDSNQLSISLYNEAVVTATGLGQTVIEEISSKPFDEKVINQYVEVPDSLTPALSLGAETGETDIYLFDDMDDFKNYSRTDSLFRLGNFNINVDVNYVEETKPDIAGNVRTFYKLATITVTNPYLKGALKLNYIASY